MTPTELKALINSDTEATTMAEAGNYADCALWCTENAPKVPGPEKRISALSLLRAFSNPATGANAWEQLEAVAAGDSFMRGVVAVAVAFMGTGGSGLDIAHPSSQAMCDSLQAAGVWTAEQASTIKALGLVAPEITCGDVQQAWEETE